MEIRTLRPDEREGLLELLDAWELPDGWRGRDYFARFMDSDPTFDFDNLWVAVNGDRIHGCVQIFPRRLRVLGHAVPTGGIGSVFTRYESRGSGIASALLDRAVEAMHTRGMELSLLFALRLKFYEKLGWRSWSGQRTVLRLSDPTSQVDESMEGAGGLELVPFARGRDLDAVKAIHSAYSAHRSGTVVRDSELWEASLKLAGNPNEEFWVARRGGSVLAYARAALLNEVFTVTELARLDEGAGALAAVMRRLLAPQKNDPIAPEGKSSQELRSFALLPSFDDIAFTVALENGGISASPLEDPTAMLRCLDVEALARRLDVTLLPNEDGAGFLSRILPSDSLVFWPADRF
jgi:GNAT superfamily N-acetyltransferase